MSLSHLFLIIPGMIMRIIKNNENNYSNVSLSASSCYHDHLQGHQVVRHQRCCERVFKSTMLQNRMIKGALDVCTKQSRKLSDTGNTKFSAAVFNVHMNKKPNNSSNFCSFFSIFLNFSVYASRNN